MEKSTICKKPYVLLVIAIVLCLTLLFDLITELIPTDEPTSESYALSYAKTAQINWLVFWPSGLVTLLVGILLRKKYFLLGNSLAIGGVYLMLLGNNGDIWASGYVVWRLVTSIISLAILMLLAVRIDYHRSPVSDQESLEGEREYSGKQSMEN
jgi:hypothetical protein